MGLRARSVVLSSGAAEALPALESSASQTLASVARRARPMRPILLADGLHGEVVKKDRIPTSLKKKRGVGNLFVEDLSSFWELLYTVVRDRGERYVVVVEITTIGRTTAGSRGAVARSGSSPSGSAAL